MSNFYLTIITFFILSLWGCANKEIIQSYIPVEAQGEDIVNAVTMGCNSPYELSQDCDMWQGANRIISIRNLEVQVAASKWGRLILIMPSQKNCDLASLNCSTVANNQNFEVIKELLYENNIFIRKVVPVVQTEYIAGYLIFLNKNGYKLLKKYTVDG